MDCAEYMGALTPKQRARLRIGKKLGQGAHACAFEVQGDPERVVKITQDQDDAFSFAELRDKGVRALPKIYGVHSLLDEQGSPRGLFAIEVERVTPLAARSTEAAAIGLFNDYLLGFEPGGFPKKIDAKAKRELGQWCVDAKDQGFVQNVTECKGVQSEAIAAYEELQRAGYAFEDAHPGNWGRDKKGKLVAIDLGYSSSAPLKKDLPTLESLMFGEQSVKEDTGATGLLLGIGFLGLMIYAFTKSKPTVEKK